MTPFSPPSVNRTLKPKKQSSGTASLVEGPAPPPSVNRQLKPHRKWLNVYVTAFDLLFEI